MDIRINLVHKDTLLESLQVVDSLSEKYFDKNTNSYEYLLKSLLQYPIDTIDGKLNFIAIGKHLCRVSCKYDETLDNIMDIFAEQTLIDHSINVVEQLKQSFLEENDEH